MFITVTHGQLSGWWQENSLPGTPRESMSSFVIGDTAYVCGGDNALIFESTNQMYAFDASSGQWTTKASHPREEVNDAPTFVIDGKGYVMGGQSSWEMDQLYSYDPSNNIWTQHADFPFYSAGGWGFTLNGKGFVANNLDTWEYDPIADSWTQRAAIPEGSSEIRGFVLSDTAFIVLSNGHTYVYDPVLDVWILRAPCPLAVLMGFAFELNGMGYLTGGSSGGPPDTEVYRYDPLLDQWFSDVAFGGLPRGNGTSFTVDGRGYVCGGVGGMVTTYYSSMWSTAALSTGVQRGPSAQGDDLTACIHGDELIIDQARGIPTDFLLYNTIGSVVARGRMNVGRTVLPIGPLASGCYVVVQPETGRFARFLKDR